MQELFRIASLSYTHLYIALRGLMTQEGYVRAAKRENTASSKGLHHAQNAELVSIVML